MAGEDEEGDRMGRTALSDADPIDSPVAKLDVIDALFFVFIFLSVFHIPLVWIGDESIGLYDIYLVFFLVFLLIFQAVRPSEAWRGYFLVVFLYFVYLLWHLVYYPTIEAILIAMKNGEMFLAMFATVAYFERREESRPSGAASLNIVMLMLVAFQLLSRFNLTSRLGFSPGFGIGKWYRVGHPFMQGTSSNPAGFVLGSYLIVYQELYLPQRPLRRTAVFLCFVASLLLTISRTNIIAYVVTVLAKYLRSITRKVRYVFFFALFLAAVVLVFYLLSNIIPKDNKLWNVIRVMQNPQDILLENTFISRYKFLWPEAFRLWSTDVFHILFGRGLGFMQVVDGTVPRLLVNKGVFGLLLFSYIWFASFLARYPKNRTLWLLLTFALVNSITGETLMISYRAVQVYIPLLISAIYLDEPMRETVLARRTRGAPAPAVPDPDGGVPSPAS
jgi:hypothetical protein